MKIHWIWIPILAIGTLFGGYYLRLAFTQPSTSVVNEVKGDARIVCTVQGVKCKGTANFFTKLYDGVDGISTIETFGSEHKAIFTFDPGIITSEKIKEIMEAPIPLRDGSTRQVFTCLELKE